MTIPNADLWVGRVYRPWDPPPPDDQCHEDVTRDGISEPCNRPPVGYRLDGGNPYPVCRKHHRPPYWLTARTEAGRQAW